MCAEDDWYLFAAHAVHVLTAVWLSTYRVPAPQSSCATQLVYWWLSSVLYVSAAHAPHVPALAAFVAIVDSFSPAVHVAWSLHATVRTPSLGWNFPVAHAVHVASDVAEYTHLNPASHVLVVLQPVWPVSSWYCVFGQSLHVTADVCASFSKNLPGAHAVPLQSVCAVSSWYCPATQSLHVTALVCASFSKNLPAAHSSPSHPVCPA